METTGSGSSSTMPNGVPFAYIEGQWAHVANQERDLCKRANPDDWRLAWHERFPHAYRLAIQTIARGEERYIVEWVEYHLSLGVNFIFIYDNNDVEGLSSFLDERLPAPSRAKVEVIPWHERMAFQQRAAVVDCVEKHAGDVKWLLAIDVDEFLNLQCSLDDFLECFSDASLVYLSWRSFNASGKLYYDDAPVRDRFTETYASRDKGQGKVMFRPSRLSRWAIHSAELSRGLAFDALHRALSPLHPFPRVFERAWIDHYFTKSLEEWVWKMERGCCDSVFCRRYAEFFDANPGMSRYFDPAAPRRQLHSLDPRDARK